MDIPNQCCGRATPQTKYTGGRNDRPRSGANGAALPGQKRVRAILVKIKVLTLHRMQHHPVEDAFL